MRAAYGNTCAYLGIQIDTAALGGLGIDHFKPKAVEAYADLIWAWENWRLACARVNARKGAHEDVLDPFTIPAGCFSYNFVALRTEVGPYLPPELARWAASTLARLKPDSITQGFHEEALRQLLEGLIAPALFAQRCPFLASELKRQGLWRWP